MANIADETQVKEQTRRGRFLREQQLADTKAILDLPAGRRFLWRYLEATGIFRLSYTGDNATFFNEGRREIGLKLLEDISEANPEAYLQMMQEAKGDLNA